MLPAKKQPLQHRGWRTTRELPVCGNVRPLSAAGKWKVLAERNPPVAPVGAWVESSPEDAEQGESLAFASAAVIEEENKQQQKEKERVLKRFQEEVKHRVNQHVKQRKKQQLQKSYEAAQKEGSVVIGFSDSALQLTPKKSTCLYRRNTDSTICSSAGVQQPSNQQWGGEMQDAQFLEQAQSVIKTVQQVRRRLASCKTVSEGGPSSELPGGSWGNRLRTQKAKTNSTTTVNTGEGHPREFPLVGYHDLPVELQEQETQKPEEHGTGCFYTIQLEKIRSDKMTGSCSAASSAVGAETQAAVVLYPGIEKEELKKERQNQYLRYRRLFMDIEREQVKEQQRQKEWQKKMDKIKKEKEHQRLTEEQRMQAATSHEVPNSSEKACEELEQLKLEDVKEKKKTAAKQQRHKEYARYVEALRDQMEKKIKMYNISLPSLCFCGSDFWDCHPDNCANNCVFYKNHKAYAQALRSVISSCNVFDGGSDTRLAVHTFATVHARSEKNS